jgi:hypothetical protein
MRNLKPKRGSIGSRRFATAPTKGGIFSARSSLNLREHSESLAKASTQNYSQWTSSALGSALGTV